MTLELAPDPVVEELRRLLPEATVRGGSFAHWLPPLAEVPAESRVGELLRARKLATNACLGDLLGKVGLPPAIPARRACGEREWPAGYVGSVSHKGTKVVVALASAGALGAIGVDIETADAGGLARVEALQAGPDLPPSLPPRIAVPVLFSVKEAAFKALFPVVRQRMAFEDLAVRWSPTHVDGVLQGSVAFRDVPVDVQCSTGVPAWIVTCALVRTV